MPVSMSLAARLGGVLVVLPLLLAACARAPGPAGVYEVGATQVSAATRAMYAPVDDGQFVVPAIPDRYLTPENVRQEVDFWSDEPPGSIMVDPYALYLYYVLGDNRRSATGSASARRGGPSRDGRRSATSASGRTGRRPPI